MSNVNRLKEVATYIENNTDEEFRWDSYWLSGSSTRVYPIECYLNENTITIQLVDRPYWYAKVRSLTKKLKDQFKDLEFTQYINKYDGSRPYELEYIINFK